MYRSTPPLVSIILPVYNCAAYVADAINSILRQTWMDFELIIIDDGSTDHSSAIISKFEDPRIIKIRQTNHGLAATLNKGIEIASGKYIARQDADDISHPTRLAKQVDFLERHTQVGLLGTWAEIWSGNQPTQRALRHPTKNEILKFKLLFDNYFVHSSVMFPKAVIQEVGPYSCDPARQPPEDYELWCRIANRFNVANLDEELVVYREVPTSISRNKAEIINRNLAHISAEAWMRLSDMDREAATQLASIYHGLAQPNQLKIKQALSLIDQAYRQSGLTPHKQEDAAALMDHRNQLLRRYLKSLAQSGQFLRGMQVALAYPFDLFNILAARFQQKRA